MKNPYIMYFYLFLECICTWKDSFLFLHKFVLQVRCRYLKLPSGPEYANTQHIFSNGKCEIPPDIYLIMLDYNSEIEVFICSRHLFSLKAVTNLQKDLFPFTPARRVLSYRLV